MILGFKSNTIASILKLDLRIVSSKLQKHRKTLTHTKRIIESALNEFEAKVHEKNTILQKRKYSNVSGGHKSQDEKYTPTNHKLSIKWYDNEWLEMKKYFGVTFNFLKSLKIKGEQLFKKFSLTKLEGEASKE